MTGHNLGTAWEEIKEDLRAFGGKLIKSKKCEKQ
jgi:hypothetical protein